MFVGRHVGIATRRMASRPPAAHLQLGGKAGNVDSQPSDTNRRKQAEAGLRNGIAEDVGKWRELEFGEPTWQADKADWLERHWITFATKLFQILADHALRERLEAAPARSRLFASARQTVDEILAAEELEEPELAVDGRLRLLEPPRDEWYRLSPGSWKWPPEEARRSIRNRILRHLIDEEIPYYERRLKVTTANERISESSRAVGSEPVRDSPPPVHARSIWLDGKILETEGVSSLVDIANMGGPSYNTLQRFAAGRPSTRDTYVRKKLAKVFHCDLNDVP